MGSDYHDGAHRGAPNGKAQPKPNESQSRWTNLAKDPNLDATFHSRPLSRGITGGRPQSAARAVNVEEYDENARPAKPVRGQEPIEYEAAPALKQRMQTIKQLVEEETP